MPAGTDHPQHRLAVITGASRGIGLALARALAARGWSLVIDARTGQELTAVATDLAKSTQVTALPGDIADPEHRAALADAAAELAGAELLVNNAATLGPSPLPTMAALPADRLSTLLQVNVVAPAALTQLLLPQLRQHHGMVVNLSSDAAVHAFATWGGYGASKAALDLISAVTAVEEPTVRIWAVDPGDIRTRLHQDAYPGQDISDRIPPHAVIPAFLRLIDERPPSGRYHAQDLLTQQTPSANQGE